MAQVILRIGGIYDGERMPGDGPALVWSYVDGTDVGSIGKSLALCNMIKF